MYNAASRKDIRRAEKDARQAEVLHLEWLRTAMSTSNGRAWFYNLLEACHLFADPFTGSALTEAYLKGERNVGLRLFSDIIAHCPDDYILMMKEANGRRTELDIRNARADSAAEYPGSSDAGWDLEGPISDANDAGLQ